MRNVPGLETVYLDYKEKGVDFFYVYKSLAHPEKSGFVQPVTLEERLSHIEAAKRQLGTEIPWLADSMTNQLKHAFGDRNNSEFVISPEGKVIIARSWSSPSQLRSDLVELVGKSETTTAISDLELKISTAIPQKPEKVATGVIPRVERPSGAIALISKSIPYSDLREAPRSSKETDSPSHPLYAKLRVEATPTRFSAGSTGTLYLGFHLDPIYPVHWNNLAAPLTFTIALPSGVTLSKASGTADIPENTPADSDPREFLLDFEIGEEVDLAEPLKLTVNYFACDDVDQWCKAVTQVYEIFLKTDRDAGRVQARGKRTGNDRGKGRGQAPQGGSPQMPSIAEMMKRMDQDGNGIVSKQEARGPVQMHFDRLDTNEDGGLDETELKTMQERRQHMRRR